MLASVLGEGSALSLGSTVADDSGDAETVVDSLGLAEGESDVELLAEASGSAGALVKTGTQNDGSPSSDGTSVATAGRAVNRVEATTASVATAAAVPRQ